MFNIETLNIGQFHKIQSQRDHRKKKILSLTEKLTKENFRNRSLTKEIFFDLLLQHYISKMVFANFQVKIR